MTRHKRTDVDVKMNAEGFWEEVAPGWLLFQGDAIIMEFDIDGTRWSQDFHMMAIETTGKDLQEAAHPENDRELEALHAGGGTDAGYEEIEINGKPHVVFLVPYDR